MKVNNFAAELRRAERFQQRMVALASHIDEVGYGDCYYQRVANVIGALEELLNCDD